MNFGKLQDISKVDFSMPSEPAFNEKIWSNSPCPTPHVYWGCTGWGMAQWVGDFYPKGTKSKDYLQHYAKQFSTIELNTTHYRIPSLNTIQKWYEESDNDFKFAPKIS